MAIADVPRAGRDPDAFHRSAIGGEDQIKAGEVQPFGRGRIQRKEVAVMCARKWKVLQKRGVQLAATERCRQTGGGGQEGEYLRAGKQCGDALRDTLASTARYKPMMDNSDAQRRLPWPATTPADLSLEQSARGVDSSTG